jgi:hypothetical protein
MDIKRVAFETKPVGRRDAEAARRGDGETRGRGEIVTSTATPPSIRREDIVALVDGFLRKKLAENPPPAVQTQSANEPKTEAQKPKTIIHDVKVDEIRNPQSAIRNGAVDFVSEDDVKNALAKNAKIYVHAKTIITPSARDLGEANEIFAKVS